jgi:hypothetical protein
MSEVREMIYDIKKRLSKKKIKDFTNQPPSE